VTGKLSSCFIRVIFFKGCRQNCACIALELSLTAMLKLGRVRGQMGLGGSVGHRTLGQHGFARKQCDNERVT